MKAIKIEKEVKLYLFTCNITKDAEDLHNEIVQHTDSYGKILKDWQHQILTRIWSNENYCTLLVRV